MLLSCVISVGKRKKIIQSLEIMTSQILARRSSHWAMWSLAIYYNVGSYAITVSSITRIKTLL